MYEVKELGATELRRGATPYLVPHIECLQFMQGST